ncbi:hypothetical protein J7M00_05655 [bacterium]|nr:hypothetical protein [bacterium]
MRARFLMPLLFLVLLLSNASAGLWDSVSNLPANVANAILDSFKGTVISFVAPILEFIKAMVLNNINPYDFQDLWLMIVSVISCFYLLLFVFAGLKFLLGSYDAVQRKSAKEWLKNAVVIVVAVNASLLLYSLMLQLSSAVALTIWTEKLDSLFDIAQLNALNLLWVVFYAFGALLLAITLLLRQLFLILGVIFVPIGIFLYFIIPLRAYGSVILNFFGAIVFMQVIDAALLLGVSMLTTQFASLEYFGTFALAVGFIVAAVVNVAILIIAIMKGLSSVAAQNPELVVVAKAVTGAVI